MTYVCGFEEHGATLEDVGGKALNLCRLAQGGFPVPPGFVVTTDAFRAALEADDLRSRVVAALAGVDADDPTSTQAASDAVRAAFAASPVPEPVAAAMLDAYGRLGGGPVAVRSSATTEDLPDLSFAGQQDTVLGVVGDQALLAALTTCWSSLWTARAISYRRRAGIADDRAALAVAVQRMVPAETSGVLFTANPLTGHRGQMTIDATFGLGEALVSGLVEPDHVVADASTGHVLRRTLGAKSVMTTVSASGAVETRAVDRAPTPALTDDDVRVLVDLGRRVQGEYGTPQDIEWAIHDGQVALLQARPVTSLFPVPENAPSDSVWLSFGAVQGVLAPISPLGRDTIRCILAGAGAALGAKFGPDANPWLQPAGERLWIRVDRALRSPLGGRVLPGVLSAVDPSARRIIVQLRREGALPPLGVSTLPEVAPRLLRFARLAGRNVVRAVRHPNAVRSELDQVTEDAVERAARAFASAASEADPLRRAAARGRAQRATLADVLPAIIPYAGVVIAGPMLALRVLTRLAGAGDQADHGVSPTVLQITRSLPNNVTTQMDLALWGVARTVRTDPVARALAADLTAPELAERYASGRLPSVVAKAVDRFLAAYGMRGVGEIDIGRRRWREDPAEVFATIQRYQQVPDDQSPPAQFERGAQTAAQAVAELAHRAGPARGRLVRFLAGHVRVLAGGRELPKFTMVRVLGLAREAWLDSGRDLVRAGALPAAEDVFLLRLGELESLGTADTATLRALVEERRSAQAREARRTQVPRILVGDGRAFYEGLGDAAGADGAITGSPVSPGTVDGPVRVVLDPSRAELRQGEILVCIGTDPAWTPLFLTAGGLVTEVGGMMTHGSVVAREYGIPAVVGVHEATTRLRTGQRIRLDGATGVILPLAEDRRVTGEREARVSVGLE